MVQKDLPNKQLLCKKPKVKKTFKQTSKGPSDIPRSHSIASSGLSTKENIKKVNSLTLIHSLRTMCWAGEDLKLYF